MVMNNVLQKDYEVYNEDTKDDLDYECFHPVHPDIAQPSPMQKVARTLLYMKEKCFKTDKVIAHTYFADPIKLCEFCGRLQRHTYLCNHQQDTEMQQVVWGLDN